MIVDTSASVDCLRHADTPHDRAVEAAIRDAEPLATPAPVVMELLAGCGNEEQVRKIQRLLARFEIHEVKDWPMSKTPRSSSASAAERARRCAP